MLIQQLYINQIQKFQSIPIQISLKSVPDGPIDNNPALA